MKPPAPGQPTGPNRVPWTAPSGPQRPHPGARSGPQQPPSGPRNPPPQPEKSSGTRAQDTVAEACLTVDPVPTPAPRQESAPCLQPSHQTHPQYTPPQYHLTCQKPIA